MGKEVERKWVLSSLPEFPADLSVVEEAIVQAYLITGPGELRIRHKGEHYVLTVKGDGTISRDEWEPKGPEAEMPEWAFNQLLQSAVGQLTKTRYTVGGILEFDVYSGKLEGLVVLEVEFPTAEIAAIFNTPDWCNVLAEVTDDPRFKNKNLALVEAVPEL